MTYSPAIPAEVRLQRHYAISTMSIEQPPRGISQATPNSLAWPLANLALYVPILIDQPVTIYEVGTGAGATAGGNFDIGLYDTAGNLLQSTGSTARTASAFNGVDWTDLVVAPGWYYAAIAADSTDNYSGMGPAAGLCEAIGICEQTSAFPLPSTATLSRTTRASVPGIMFAVRSLGV